MTALLQQAPTARRPESSRGLGATGGCRRTGRFNRSGRTADRATAADDEQAAADGRRGDQTRTDRHLDVARADRSAETALRTARGEHSEGCRGGLPGVVAPDGQAVVAGRRVVADPGSGDRLTAAVTTGATVTTVTTGTAVATGAPVTAVTTGAAVTTVTPVTTVTTGATVTTVTPVTTGTAVITVTTVTPVITVTTGAAVTTVTPVITVTTGAAVTAVTTGTPVTTVVRAGTGERGVREGVRADHTTAPATVDGDGQNAAREDGRRVDLYVPRAVAATGGRHGSAQSDGREGGHRRCESA
ncbi:hypothetical protein [Streptomyces sp. V1I6]|uniref:hypothetical protein n=1 Tax=Streptomyces sp. V1I6 TaxID=3042273 RepID=UPI00278A497A|nr:hypothetical protein [Streptomyces sp. V1I6]MDQ0846851.1 hypothetical protein [Streptomyces sp. V1I6]